MQYCVADVSRSGDVQRYTAEAVRAYGKIDVFFNNVGIEGIVKPIEDYPEDVFDYVLAQG